jgi:O-antigen ligase
MACEPPCPAASSSGAFPGSEDAETHAINSIEQTFMIKTQIVSLQKFPWRPTASYPLLLARYFAIVTLWIVPISTAGVNIGSGLVLLCAALSPEVWAACSQLRLGARSFVVAIAIFVALAISLFYTSANLMDALDFLLKYRKLLFLPVLFLVFHDNQEPRYTSVAVWGLFVTLTLTMFLSYSNFFGWTALGPMHGSDSISKPWVFKDHISGGLMMAFLFSLTLTLAQALESTRVRALLHAIGFLALVNVLFVLEGRTGQVVAITFLLVHTGSRLTESKWRNGGAARQIAGLAGVIGCVCLVFFSVTAKHSRLANIGQEISQFELKNQDTSVGIRLEFYRRSTELMINKPLIGYGVGSVQTEFERLAKNSTGGRASIAGNPHNEFFLMGVQLGLAGMGSFVWLLILVGRECRQLANPARTVVYGFLFAFALGSLANSFLVNFTEGNLFIFLTGILLYGAPLRIPKSGSATA